MNARRKRFNVMDSRQLLDLEIGMRRYGGVVVAINRADLWMEVEFA